MLISITAPRSQYAFERTWLKLPLAALLLALISTSCGSQSESTPASCVPGKTEACACAGGRIGAQQCLGNGGFGPCECQGGASGPDAGIGERAPEAGGAGAPPVEGGPAASPAVREFCDRTIAAFAAKAANCCSEADRTTAKFASLDGDRRAMATECEPMISNAIASGRIRFDSDRAKACSSALRSKIENLPCSSQEVRAPMTWDAAACEGVVLGLQGVDQPCRRPSECRPGLACVGYGENTEGACRALPGGDDACTPVRAGMVVFPFDTALPLCAPNLTCTRNSEGEDDETRCYPLRNSGDRCESTAWDCKPGLFCATVCMPYRAVGEACTSSPFACTPGFTCNSANKCAEGIEGAPCSYDVQCSGLCVLDINGNGTCRAFCGSR